MKLAKLHYRDENFIGKLFKDMDLENPAFIKSRLDEIYQKQPLLHSILLDYKGEFSQKEYKEIVNVYLIIWNYYRSVRNLKEITPGFYFELVTKNMERHPLYVADPGSSGKIDFDAFDLKDTDPDIIFMVVWIRFTSIRALKMIKVEKKHKILIEMKSLIECFEAHGG